MRKEMLQRSIDPVSFIRSSPRVENKVRSRPSSLVFYVEGAQFFLHPFPYLRVRLWFDLARSEARTGFTLLVGAIGTLCSVRGIGREFRLAFVALIMGDRLGAELVAWISVGVSIFLGWVTGAIRATGVLAPWAGLLRSWE